MRGLNSSFVYALSADCVRALFGSTLGSHDLDRDCGTAGPAQRNIHNRPVTGRTRNVTKGRFWFRVLLGQQCSS